MATEVDKRLLLSKRQSRTMTTAHTNKEIAKSVTLLAETPLNLSNLSVSLKKLHTYSSKLSTLTEQIHAMLDEQSLVADAQKAEEVQECILDATAQLETAMASLTASHSAHDDTVNSNGGGGLFPHSVKLPKLMIQKFDGDPMKWEEFWDTYLNTVHRNSSLPPVDKFKYLKGLLEGTALVLAEGYRLTAANYDAVIAALKDRFGNPELAIFSHFDAMLALSSVSDRVSDLQRTFDECERHIRSLVALGLNEAEFGKVFTPIIMSKLPAELRVELHRRNGSAPWTLSNLREYFKDEIQARDMSSRAFGASHDESHKHGTKEQGSGKRNSTWQHGQGTASALVSSDTGSRFCSKSNIGTRTIQCKFCHGDHYSDQCKQFSDLAARRKKLNNSCFSCLGKGHLSRYYRVARKCIYCGVEGHHRSLCFKQFGANGTKNAIQTAGGQQSKSKDSALVTETMLVSGCRGVLQTALTEVRGESKTTQARILFDTGADQAFILNSMASQLGAQCLGSETISLAGFQDSRRCQSSRKIYQFDILLRDGRTFTVKAYGTDKITCPIDKYRFDIAANPVLTQVQLAEPLSQTHSHVSVDILLGSDYYYRLLNTKTPPMVLDSGLVLLDSKVGYIIGGCIDCSGSSRTNLLLSRGTDWLDTASNIESLWQLEAIGITEASDSLEGELALSEFNRTITFSKQDRRYEVRWPWNGKEDCMYRGPVILENLCSLLLRFRLHPIGIVSYLEKAFLQIGIQNPDRDAVRFLWLKDMAGPVTIENIEQYRFRRVCFGVISSPFLLGATLMYHLNKVGTPVAEQIKETLYVDNIITGATSTADAQKFYEEAKSIFASASMNLREWFSNNLEFMNQLPDIDKGKGSLTKVLGLTWDLTTDKLICNQSSTVSHASDTKRAILQLVAKIYDPCGYWLPVTAPGKWLLQELWTAGYDWDDPVADEPRNKWLSLHRELSQLSQCPVPRYCGWCKDARSSVMELHTFCDASAKAYCAVVYMRQPGNLPVLVFSKCRVAPAKKQTIPRLELLAIVLGVRVLKFVSKEIGIPVTAKYVWSDAQCALHWVLGRCPSADLPTRGMSVQALKTSELWWNGPPWLKDKSCWPDLVLPDRPDEERQTTTEGASINVVGTLNADICRSPIDANKFSKLTKLLRVTAYVFRFVGALKQPQPDGGTRLTASELNAAQLYWEKQVQHEHFNLTKFRGGQLPKQLKRLGPLFLDSRGILRRKGRLQNAAIPYDTQNPKVMPRNCRFVSLLIQDIHDQLNHAGVAHVLSETRATYWILRGRSQIKQTLRQCLKCRRLSGGPYQIPPAPALPVFRVSDMRPFCYVGIDYFGPLYIQDSAAQTPSKVWVLLATCASTRAVHLEVVTSMDATQFLLAFRRFMSICGTPMMVVSHNAKQFHSAKRLFDRLWYSICQSEQVQDFSSRRQIDWKFIPEASPWMGGFYERSGTKSLLQPWKTSGPLPRLRTTVS